MIEQQFTTEELNSEEWKAVPRYEGLYEVSSLGRFRSLRFHGKQRVRLLSLSIGSKGYIVISLYKNKKPHAYNAHSLVASAFLIPNRPEQTQVNHKDLNKANNRITNLEWNTAKEDGEHRVRTGAAASGERHYSQTMPHRVPRGKRHGTKTKPHRIARGDQSGMRKHPESVRRGSSNKASKITEEIVRQMRQAYNLLSDYRAVAEAFGVSETNTHRIIKRQSWKHVD